MSKNRTVYSTERGRVCSKCNRPADSCICAKKKNTFKSDGVVRIKREVKGRGGKTVTTVSGISLNPGDLKELAGELKKKCGSGGTVKEGIIIIQGDRREVIFQMLEKKGFLVKLAGG